MLTAGAGQERWWGTSTCMTCSISSGMPLSPTTGALPVLMRVFSTMYSRIAVDTYYQLCAIRYYMTDGSGEDDSEFLETTQYR